MANEENSYKSIFKATSILGGVQVFSILISIVKTKIVAILLGPIGMGVLSIFTSTLTLIGQMTYLGVGTSGVKNIAIASEKGNLARINFIFWRLILITGIFGFIVALVLSPVLSKIAFGNSTYTLSFVFLSISLFFTQVNNGQNAVLQGVRRIGFMAKATVLGAFVGLLVSIPFYYFLKENGIVPSLIITSISTVCVTFVYVKKLNLPKYSDPIKILDAEGIDMLRMGILIGLSGVFTLLVAYLVRIFINNIGGLSDVGFYTAGFAIINTYVGMVFTAMSTDYYPRLSRVCHDVKKANSTINEQAEIALLVLAPILIIFLVFIKFGVILLYSKEFIAVIPMIYWATLGIFFKALSWSIAFIFLAKGSSKAFFWNEFLASIYILIGNVLGYYYYGLVGLGVSYLLSFMIYFLQVWIVSKCLYSFKLEKNVIKLFIMQLCLAVICFLNVKLLNQMYSYIIGIFIILLSISISLYQINKRISISEIIQKKLKKTNGNK